MAAEETHLSNCCRYKFVMSDDELEDLVLEGARLTLDHGDSFHQDDAPKAPFK